MSAAMPRLAFVDLLFSWPPNGGADVDLYHTMTGLQRLGYDVHLFLAGYPRSWERGVADTEQLPFSATRLDFTWRTLTPRTLPRRLRAAVDEWQPDVVVLMHGFFLKPYVIEAFSDYPTVGRYYAYEVACPRDLRLFKDGAPCPNNVLATPDICRPCALEGIRDRLVRWRILAWEQEYLVGRAFMPGYPARRAKALASLDGIVVSNSLMESQLDGVNDHVHVMPGGVDVADFSVVPPPVLVPGERKVILMSGRVEDPLKGLDTVLKAGAILAQDRNDFEIRATHSDRSLATEWFTPLGWHGHDAVAGFHNDAHICVVPSVWEEPFGLAAVEAMAAGRPVCASRIGGLQHIVRDGETGFLCTPGDAEEWALRLGQLLDDAPLRETMGAAGRRVAETEYDWARVIERHWPPILEGIRP